MVIVVLGAQKTRCILGRMYSGINHGDHRISYAKNVPSLYGCAETSSTAVVLCVRFSKSMKAIIALMSLAVMGMK